MRLFILPLLLCAAVSSTAQADSAYWARHQANAAVDATLAAPTHNLDYARLEALLLTATRTQPVRISLPLPDGSLRAFDAYYAPVMEAELANRYSFIRSYKAYAADDAAVTARLDTGPKGFHAYISLGDETVLIDPAGAAGTDVYTTTTHRAYRDAHRGAAADHACALTAAMRERFEQQRPARPASAAAVPASAARDLARTQGGYRTYRLAVSTTVTYSSQVGGTVPTVLAEVNTAINRINEIYERDLGIQLLLIANNDLLIATSEPDGFTDDNDLPLLMDENQSKVNTLIGSANYDIGHVLSGGFGGLASLGVACDNGFKARGATGRSGRSGDAFYIDLLAHEIGHQFGADHSFNGTSGSCFGSRNPPTAYEPGSGVTIMAYAGLCDAEDVAGSSIASFHAGSIEQIIAYARSGGQGAACAGTASAPPSAGNNAPTVDAGSDYTIPGATPFVLSTAASNDVDGDTLLYNWEQLDAGQATTTCSYGKDLGSNALFRSYQPGSDDSRTFPQLATLKANSVDKAEKLPTQSRDLNFRLTAVDGKGGVAEDDMVVTVAATAGPFSLLQPDGGGALDSNATVTHTVEWHTGCTGQAPVNCGAVDIELSIDGGDNWSTVLAATPNDGMQAVSFNGEGSLNARLRIACANNIFFDISDADFTLVDSGTGTGTALAATGNGGTGSCGTSVPNTCVVNNPGNDIEPNDTVNTAQFVTVPFQITGSVDDALDGSDYYSFVASAGSHTFVLNNYGSNDLDLYLVDSDGFTELGFSESAFDTTERITRQLVGGRTYYVEVRAFDTLNQASTYDLAIFTGSSSSSSSSSGALSVTVLGLPWLASMLRAACRRRRVRPRLRATGGCRG